MAVTYRSSLHKVGRVLSTLVNPTLDQCIGKDVYCIIDHNREYKVLDISKILRRIPNLDTTITLSAYVQSLNDFEVAKYVTNEIPLKSLDGRYKKRIEAIDPTVELGMQIDYVNHQNPSIRNDRTMRSTFNDLVISSEDRDLSNSLVSVNGVFHPTIHFDNELYVIDGFSNVRINGSARIGLFDTAHIGGHSVTKITTDMLVMEDADTMRNGVYLKLNDGASFANTTTLVVIDGYLLPPINNYFKVVGDQLLKLNLNKLDLLHMYLHNPMTKVETTPIYGGNLDPDNIYTQGRTVIDAYLSKMWPFRDIDTSGNKVGHHSFELTGDVDDYNSDTFIRNMLFSPMSFIIHIYNPNVYMKTYKLNRTVECGEYEIFSEDMPRGLLWYNREFILPYVKYSAEDHQHTVSFGEHLKYSDLYKTAINPSMVPMVKWDTIDTSMEKPVEMLEFYAP